MPGRRRLPSLLALRAFEAAARHSSFTEAAEELHVSQAAISRHVRSLESDLGKPLFRRLHRRVQLTSTGRTLATELTESFVRIQKAVKLARGSAFHRLRVTVEPAFAARWLVQRLGTFASAHPEIELELESSDEIRVLGAEADIAVRYIAAGSARRMRGARRLFSIEGVPVVAGSYSKGGRHRADEEILEHRLLHDDDGSAWRGWFAAAGLNSFDQARHQYFSDYSMALAAAQAGQGAALGADLFIEPELRRGRLLQLGTTRVDFGTYWLLESRGRLGRAPRAAFVRWLEGEAAKVSGSKVEAARSGAMR